MQKHFMRQLDIKKNCMYCYSVSSRWDLCNCLSRISESQRDSFHGSLSGNVLSLHLGWGKVVEPSKGVYPFQNGISQSDGKVKHDTDRGDCWGTNAAVAPDCFGEERVAPEGKAFDLLVDLHFSPCSWPWALGSVQTKEIHRVTWLRPALEMDEELKQWFQRTFVSETSGASWTR